MLYTGIDIGGTKCAVVIGNENCEILNKISFPTTTLEETLKNIIEAVRKIGVGEAIGISCGGPLDSKRGVIMSPPNLVGWDNVPITDIMEKEFGVKAYLKNDADACALAEWKFGAGKNCENMVFLTFGTGLGAGLILNGRLYSGSCDMAGEVGHIRLERFGPVGYGKAGSFEGFCSGGGIAQFGMMMAREKLQMGKTVSYCKDMSELEKISAKSIAQSANEGNEDAAEVYRLCGEMLGKGLAVIVDILNPERIVIGSIFQRSENLLRESMEKTLKEETLSGAYNACRIVGAELEESLGDCAALCVAKNGMEERN